MACLSNPEARSLRLGTCLGRCEVRFETYPESGLILIGYAALRSGKDDWMMGKEALDDIKKYQQDSKSNCPHGHLKLTTGCLPTVGAIAFRNVHFESLQSKRP